MGASRSSHLILATTAAFLIVALLWAANATLDEVTRGDGKVIPSSKVQVVQNLEGDILDRILVRKGEMVERDQPLLQLDDTRFSSTFRETRLKYLALLAKSARLQAEANNQPLQIQEIVWQEREDLARNEVALFESRAIELESNLSILREQESQTGHELAELLSKKDRIARSYELVQQELAMSEPLADEGAISEVEILRLKRTVNDLRGDLDASPAGDTPAAVGHGGDERLDRRSRDQLPHPGAR